MIRRNVILTAIFIFLPLCRLSWAAPTTPYEAEMVVTGWLKADPQPLGMALGWQMMKVETFTWDNGEPIYYIVYLQPSGFVIVPADDLIEPIIGFVNGNSYDPSIENPLGALVTNDLHGRIEAIRSSFNPLVVTPQTEVTRTQKKWKYWMGLGETSDGFRLFGGDPICDSIPFDVRVAPLVETKWNQGSAYYELAPNWRACYNYYTPRLLGNTPKWDPDRSDNYPSGCVATAMAQLMRYHTYPDQPNQLNDPCEVRIGVKDDQGTFNDDNTVYPDGTPPMRSLLGGNEQGGAYRWSDMEPVPDNKATQKQRKAIGAICHDAGVAVNMDYSSGGSGANTLDAADALKRKFEYSNAVKGYSGGAHIGPGLMGMINPNLDAQNPVILGIPGHAVVVDGYGFGYNQKDSTPYHHLNMGWSGLDDCWYNLPSIECKEIENEFSSAYRCVYNIFKKVNGEAVNGEIISGRVLDLDGDPADANRVVLEREGTTVKTTETDTNGIFAFVGVDSDTAYTIWVEERALLKRQVHTGTSRDNQSVSGNRWGIDFPGSPEQEILYVNCNIDAGANDGSDWDNAFIDLQDAIDVAVNSGGEVTEIWVAKGAYKPDKDTGLRTLSFQLLDGVGIYGGFAGGETQRAQRNPKVNKTILSGDLTGDENSYHVVNGSGTERTAIIDGFTITDGDANGKGNEARGGGMYIYHGNPTVSHCSFSNNLAVESGGGIYNENSSPVVIDCHFTDNVSWAYGGGMSNYSNSHPEVSRCTFVENSATEWGGAIENYLDCSPIVTHCVFSGNQTDGYGGGTENINNSHPVVTNCTFSGNSAQVAGGGLDIYESYVNIINCIIWGNLGGQLEGDATVSYSDVESWAPWPGTGNINEDPLFAQPDNGDFHLKSQVGRWNPVNQNWSIDNVTSPCIDAGDPGIPVGDEPVPNGGTINMGAYGGTIEASKSL